jgi:hypothetical protein
MPIRGRCTVQKLNFDRLRDTVWQHSGLAEFNLIPCHRRPEFEAFNREGGWTSQRQDEVALTFQQVDCLEREIESVIYDHAAAIDSGLPGGSSRETAPHCFALQGSLGQSRHIAPRCNAPGFQAVIEADGTVRPAFSIAAWATSTKDPFPQSSTIKKPSTPGVTGRSQQSGLSEVWFAPVPGPRQHPTALTAAGRDIMHIAKEARETLKQLVFGSATVPQQCGIGLRDPQSEVSVWLHGFGPPRDVTIETLRRLPGLSPSGWDSGQNDSG